MLSDEDVQGAYADGFDEGREEGYREGYEDGQKSREIVEVMTKEQIGVIYSQAQTSE